MRVPAFGDEHESGHEGESDDRNVYEKYGAPPEVLEKKASGKGAETDAQSGDPGSYCDSFATLFSGEHVGEDRQG